MFSHEGKATREGRWQTMVDRSPIKGKTIVISDRGYESYNNFAHIERKGWNYVIRVKDVNSSGILPQNSNPSQVRDNTNHF